MTNGRTINGEDPGNPETEPPPHISVPEGPVDIQYQESVDAQDVNGSLEPHFQQKLTSPAPLDAGTTEGLFFNAIDTNDNLVPSESAATEPAIIDHTQSEHDSSNAAPDKSQHFSAQTHNSVNGENVGMDAYPAARDMSNLMMQDKEFEDLIDFNGSNNDFNIAGTEIQQEGANPYAQTDTVQGMQPSGQHYMQTQQFPQGQQYDPLPQHYPPPPAPMQPHTPAHPYIPDQRSWSNGVTDRGQAPDSYGFNRMQQSAPMPNARNPNLEYMDKFYPTPPKMPPQMPSQMTGQMMGPYGQNRMPNNSGVSNSINAMDLNRAILAQRQQAIIAQKGKYTNLNRSTRPPHEVYYPPSPNMSQTFMPNVGQNDTQMSDNRFLNYYNSPGLAAMSMAHMPANPQQVYQNSPSHGHNGQLPIVPTLPSNATPPRPAYQTLPSAQAAAGNSKKRPVPSSSSDEQNGNAVKKGGNKKPAPKHVKRTHFAPAQEAEEQDTDESYHQSEYGEEATSPESKSSNDSSGGTKSDPVDLSSPGAQSVQALQHDQEGSVTEDFQPLADIGSWKLPTYEVSLERPTKKDDYAVAKISIPGIVREEIYLSPEYSAQEMHLFVNVFLPAHKALNEPDPEPAHAILNFHTISNMVMDAYVQYEIGDVFGLSNNNPAYGAKATQDNEEYERRYDAQDADIDDIFFAVVDRWRAGLESKKEPAHLVRGSREFTDVALDVIQYIKENGMVAQPKERKQRKDKGVPRKKAGETATPAAGAKGKGKAKEEKTPTKRAAEQNVNTLQARKKTKVAPGNTTPKVAQKTTPPKATQKKAPTEVVKPFKVKEVGVYKAS